MSGLCGVCGTTEFTCCPTCQTLESIASNFIDVTDPDLSPRAWIIESKSCVSVTIYASVAECFAMSPLHVVTPYVSKL